MSSKFQTQIHNLRMARECVIGGQQPVTKLNIAVGDLVLVRNHTSKCFMSKYKLDFHVLRIEGNKVEVKDNRCKLCWYHISDVKKTNMVTKVVCQLPDVNGFGRKGRLSFDLECIQNLGWTPDDWKCKFNPDYIKDIPDAVQKTNTQTNTHRLFNVVEYIRHYDTLSWIKS